MNSPNSFDFDSILARRDLAETTRYRYGREVTAAIDAGVNLLNSTAVADYAAELPSSRKMFLRAAVGLIADEVVQTAKSNATPGNVANMQAAMWRAEALKGCIHVKPKKGQRAHKWLNLAQVKHVLDLCGDDDIKGLRDRVVLSLLVGAGLRRQELADLTWADVELQGDRVVLSIRGKGSKNRVVPISGKLADLLVRWKAAAGPGEFVARSIDKGGNVGDSMSGQAILDVVKDYGRKIDEPGLRPHDLRRTYARIGYDAGVDIGQISLLLGHASIATTQRYLGLEIDSKKTVSDFVPM